MMTPLLLKIAATSVLLTVNVKSHVYLSDPVSRSYWNSPFFQNEEDGSPLGSISYCPHCNQSRGPASVRARAEANTDPDLLAKFGNGEWPHKISYGRGGVSSNGNYLEADGISVKHGVCGDPSQTSLEGTSKHVRAREQCLPHSL